MDSAFKKYGPFVILAGILVLSGWAYWEWRRGNVWMSGYLGGCVGVLVITVIIGLFSIIKTNCELKQMKKHPVFYYCAGCRRRLGGYLDKCCRGKSGSYDVIESWIDHGDRYGGN